MVYCKRNLIRISKLKKKKTKTKVDSNIHLSKLKSRYIKCVLKVSITLVNRNKHTHIVLAVEVLRNISVYKYFTHYCIKKNIVKIFKMT